MSRVKEVLPPIVVFCSIIGACIVVFLVPHAFLVFGLLDRTPGPHPKDPWMVRGTIARRYSIHAIEGDNFRVTVVYNQTLHHRMYYVYLDEKRNGKYRSVFEQREIIENGKVARNPFAKIRLTLVYDAPELRCYEFWSGTEVLFTQKPFGNYQVFNYSDFNYISPNKFPLLIPFAREKFLSQDSRYTYTLARFLLQANDTAAKQALMRYAHGRFTAMELQKKFPTAQARSHVRRYARKLLK